MRIVVLSESAAADESKDLFPTFYTEWSRSVASSPSSAPALIVYPEPRTACLSPALLDRSPSQV